MVAKVLQRPTLVLNRNWQPVNVATVECALTMLWNESARVVDPHDYQMYIWADWSQLAPLEGEPFIQAIRMRLRIPEVVTLTDYDRLPAAACKAASSGFDSSRRGDAMPSPAPLRYRLKSTDGDSQPGRATPPGGRAALPGRRRQSRGNLGLAAQAGLGMARRRWAEPLDEQARITRPLSS
jgi:hypothetical protein